MGIGSWILSLGISLEQTAESFGIRGGRVPIQWPAGQPGSIIYRLPRDPHQRSSLFATNQTIVVNEGEVALVLEDGVAGGALSPGRYVFQKARVVGSLDIIWFRTGQQGLKWGIGNVTSTDGIQISANGVIYVRVAEAISFNTEVVQGAVTLAEMDLQRFLMPRIQGVLRQTITSWDAMTLQTQRETFIHAVRNALGNTFRDMGLEIIDFEIIEITFPPEFKAVLAQAAMASHQGKAALIDAQTKAQIRQLEAASEANAKLLDGQADVQIMAQLQAQGIDPLQVKALEAAQIMAENPVQGTLIGGDARAGMIGQLAGAALASSPSAATGAPPQAPAVPQLPATTANTPDTPVGPPTTSPPAQPPMAQAAPDEPARGTVEYYEAQIEKLDDRVAEGTITEEFYEKQVARIEAKISKLQGQ